MNVVMVTRYCTCQQILVLRKRDKATLPDLYTVMGDILRYVLLGWKILQEIYYTMLDQPNLTNTITEHQLWNLIITMAMTHTLHTQTDPTHLKLRHSSITFLTRWCGIFRTIKSLHLIIECSLVYNV